jgi:hypothetical protein
MNYSNIKKIKFTISVSPALSKFNMNILSNDNILEKLMGVAGRIYDINFTCNIPPFEVDAHGVNLSEIENKIHLKQMAALQGKTNIQVTPVFNNIFVPNTYEKLNEFVENFKPLYDLGIRSVSIPHVLWMKIGLFQKNFPDVKIKNTVLRKVRSGQDFWNHAEAGYHYINLDQEVVRNRKALKEIYSAQIKFKEETGKHIVTSIITGEGCLGSCPLKDEHYLHTMTHHDTKNPVKNTEIFRYPQYFSCLSTTDPLINSPMFLGMPPHRDDLDEICSYFDIIKLAGRRAFQSFSDCINIIESITDGQDEFAFPPSDIIKFLHENPEKYQASLTRWRKVVKSCRFQCWQCNVCTDLIGNYMSDADCYS